MNDKDKLFDDFGLKRLKESYMLESETTPQDRFKFVAKMFSSSEKHANRLYNYLSNFWLSLSTPLLSYGKTKNGLPISCFLSYIDDTSEGLLNSLTEINQLSMLGGGVGIGVGIRSADDKSTGVMAHLKTYDACSLAYKQDGIRRGSYAAYLDINHPDILPFIDMRKPTGDHNIRCLNLHHGINITDKFMELINKCSNEKNVDDSWELIDPHTKQIKNIISAKELWQRILETRLRTGEPYICFIDTCNRYMKSFQKKLGLSIKQSNLCVSGNTLLFTSIGHYPIRTLKDQWVEIWNGTEFSAVYIQQTNKDATVNKVIFSDGSFLICTPYHKFIQWQPSTCIKDCKKVEAKKELKIKRTIYPKIMGNSLYDIQYPYTKGFMSEDVPYNASLNCRKQWLSGLIDGHGILSEDSSILFISLNTYKLAFETKILLASLGIVCNIICLNQSYIISVYTYIFLLGLETKNVISSKTVFPTDEYNFLKINDIIPINEKEDTYCFTEMNNNAGTFNSVLTGNCSEIILPTDKNRTAVCCLSSLNLSHYDNWCNHPFFIKDVMEMLDNALTIFINTAPKRINKAIFSATKERSIGVGVLGFHDYLQKHMIPFESEVASRINKNIFNHISKQIHFANLELGAQRGTPDDCIGTGRRFANTIAIAPTATTSIIMGTSPSIEPYRANAFRQDTLSGACLNKNKNLEKLLIKKLQIMDKYSEKNITKIWNNILTNQGSIQHLNIFNDIEKSVFKTALEIDQKWIISHAVERQKYIDQSQSLNLFFNPTVSIKTLHECHFTAWAWQLKTLYYCRSTKLVESDKINSDTLDFFEDNVCTIDKECEVCQ
ncbi:hypothetical protein AGMMS49579_01240 [Spirochaetia bacterium]|nr:hypothetical protein AGMMS49579_01240 [Spirochaetia bacterium]